MRLLAVLALSLLCLPGIALAEGTGPSPVGTWLTPDGEGVIQVRACETGFCGRIVGMSKLIGDDGKPPSDPHGRPNCGRDILHLGPNARDGRWAGDILDPDDDSDWRCEVWVQSGRMELRGYVLTPLLGKTQSWTPYGGSVSSTCAMSP